MTDKQKTAVKVGVGTAVAGALAAGLVAAFSKKKSPTSKTNTAGPAKKNKGCGGCGR
jgi:hypothetical protein